MHAAQWLGDRESFNHYHVYGNSNRAKWKHDHAKGDGDRFQNHTRWHP